MLYYTLLNYIILYYTRFDSSEMFQLSMKMEDFYFFACHCQVSYCIALSVHDD